MPIRGPPIADRLSLISFIDAFSMPTTTPFSAAVPGAQHADFGRPFPTFHTASLAYASIRTHTNTGLCNFTSHSLAAASNPPLNYHGRYFAPDLPPILSHPQHPYRTKCKELPPPKSPVKPQQLNWLRLRTTRHAWRIKKVETGLYRFLLQCTRLEPLTNPSAITEKKSIEDFDDTNDSIIAVGNS